MIAESYGWKVASNKAREIFKKIEELLSKEELCWQIVNQLSSDQLAWCLARVLRDHDLEEIEKEAH